MNYFIYNNLKFFYDDIKYYIVKNKNIKLELIVSSYNEAFDIWEVLKENLNLIFQLYNNYSNLNFLLQECYINNNLLILQGEIK